MIAESRTDTRSVTNIDAQGHVTGRSLYLDDLPVLEGTLFAKIFDSPVAHGIVRRLDWSRAAEAPGVVRIFSAKDIPGENNIGGIIHDEPLLAEEKVIFRGQPLLLVVAETEEAAEAALHLIDVEIDPLPVITDPKEAFKQGQLLCSSRQFKKGDVENAFAGCAHVFEGEAETGGQEHLYLETHGAYAYPLENQNIRVYSSTQGLRHVQETVAHLLGLGMHAVEVDVTRLGGGFGGKEDQAAMWASMCGLAVHHLRKPVKCVPHRMEDMRMSGKRNPYKCDYRIGLDADYKIVAYEATYYQNGGAAADLSPAIQERTLFHGTNTYGIEHVHLTTHSCRTNLPPNTAFRGFGGPQGMFMIESAIDQAAKALGLETADLQRRNLMQEGYEFSYGQIAQGVAAAECWDEAAQRFDLEDRRIQVDAFNAAHPWKKKGLSLMPICFGISFTNTMMNQARSLVHIYWDGSVSVSTGAVEMGQGINTKMLQVAAECFGIRHGRIRVESTNTTRVANTSPSAASATADLNGRAVEDACRQLTDRLKEVAAALANVDAASISIREEQVYTNGLDTGINWNALIAAAFQRRVNLSAKGHYSTPDIHFDKTKEKGHPFAYHVYGTALTEVIVDCLRGTYELDAVEVVHDFGSSINTLIDLGQCEGGIVQGIGWMTMEEVVYNEQGKLLSNALSTYKIPDIYSVPKVLDIHFLQTVGHPMAIKGSKAVGEPPLMYGIGAFFALRNAVLAFNPNAQVPYVSPITPERVLMGLYS
ncbi:xanthine dehydrogenase molybdopterin binding subunit [Flaviaesturariibacter aridisoli]|uniref:xanthine dehydrogenase molybdopterin binding subunit n=1 Tax=Flaviaesturariibacter aridisoli TaxID=2545761 RepID=UPI001FB6FE77|nr:molybdopterin cofactor-binding domain-containing protein [Flaviaesturariibacter aridisoli]